MKKSLILLCWITLNWSCLSSVPEIHIVHLEALRGAIFPIEKINESGTFHEGGISLISQKLNEIKKEIDPQPLILIGNSNFIHGTVETYFTKGEAIIEAMNYLGFSALVLGHREFYFGQKTLADLARKAEFPFLSADIVHENGSTPEFLKPYLVLDSESAIIGISGSDTFAKNLDETMKGLRLLPARETIEKYAEQLRNVGIKRVYVASAVDIKIKSNAEAEALLNAKGVELLLVSTASEELRGKNEVYFIKTPDGKMKKILPAAGRKGATIGHYQRLPDGHESYKIFPINSKHLKPDPAMSEFMYRLKQSVDRIGSDVIGQTKYDIPHSDSRESELGNLVTDILRQYAQSEIFVTNSGIMRDGFKKGDITRRHLYALLPFGGNIVETAGMTGAQVLKLLEKSCSFRYPRSFLQVSGVSFRYDPRKKIGNRVLENSVKINGQNLDKNRIYNLATDLYIYRGGDDYNEFKEMKIGVKKIHTRATRNIIEDYIKKQGTIRGSITGRIVRIP